MAKARALLTLVVFTLTACSSGRPDVLVTDGARVIVSDEPAQPLTAVSRGETPRLMASHSPTEVFRGIIFSDGPVADLIPTIRDNIRLSNHLEGEDLAAGRAFVDRLMAHIGGASDLLCNLIWVGAVGFGG